VINRHIRSIWCENSGIDDGFKQHGFDTAVDYESVMRVEERHKCREFRPGENGQQHKCREFRPRENECCPDNLNK